MEFIIVYAVIAVSFSITFYFRYMLETFATIKQFENIYYDEGFKSAVNLGYHIGSLLAGVYYFPKLFTKLFEKREDVIKELAKDFIRVQYGEIEK